MYSALKLKSELFFYCNKRCSSTSRVVVTGLGIICPLGVGVKHVWSKLINSQTGVVKINNNEYNDIPCKVAAFVPRGKQLGDFDFQDSDLKKMSLASLYALSAAEEALRDANWFPRCTDSLERTGVAVGSGMVDLLDIISTGNVLKQRGYGKISPYFVPRILSNMSAGHIAMKYGFKGPNHSVSTACATGLHAIGDAYNFIKSNHASVMVCGSTEAVISPVSIAGFCRMRALSTNFNDQPGKASRPFDKDRDGFVMGEGAGILILESLSHALERGASIYAEILGYGLSCDAYHITSPNLTGDGAYRCMRQALEQSKVNKSDVGYINAHATSTPLGDEIEVKAIFDLFQEHSKSLIVSSTKGATGHLLGASGSIEAVFTILSCYFNLIPPNVNLNNSNFQWPVNIAGNNLQCWPQTINNRIGLTNSFGFGGTNASIIFCKNNF